MLSYTTNVGTTPELKDLGFNCRPALDNYAKKYIPVHQVFKQLHNRINDSKVPTDLFEWKGQEFILVVDYFSRYCEIGVLQKSTSQEVISHLKAIFARHGIPKTVISDNSPQNSSAKFSKFAQEWEFTHVTSSGKYPQSNGEA